MNKNPCKNNRKKSIAQTKVPVMRKINTFDAMLKLIIWIEVNNSSENKFQILTTRSLKKFAHKHAAWNIQD